jgi:chemotaxis methyl-accepting protein methylase
MIPPGLRDSSPVLSYGEGLHWLVRLLDKRQQYYGTFFLRNRPALELMRRIAVPKAERATLRIAVLACSSGAEVYSILWTIRSARPDLKVVVRAVDISEEIVDVARRGVYVPDASGLVGSTIFERMTAHEMDQMFDREGEAASIKPWLREGITWQVGDASSPELIHDLGRQDIVVASNFLCHMDPPAAETCLRNIAGLVDRDGSLFVSGVDLAVRTKVAQELGWRLVPELREQIHDGDPKLREGWPLCWWGLEPLDRRRKDWQLRYTAVFQIPDHEPQ